MYSNYGAIRNFKMITLSHLSADDFRSIRSDGEEKGMSNRKFDLGSRFIVAGKCWLILCGFMETTSSIVNFP